jgi:hypothetical protein
MQQRTLPLSCTYMQDVEVIFLIEFFDHNLYICLLAKMSPTSLKITHRELMKGAELSSLKMEYIVQAPYTVIEECNCLF